MLIIILFLAFLGHNNSQFIILNSELPYQPAKVLLFFDICNLVGVFFVKMQFYIYGILLNRKFLLSLHKNLYDE